MVIAINKHLKLKIKEGRDTVNGVHEVYLEYSV